MTLTDQSIRVTIEAQANTDERPGYGFPKTVHTETFTLLVMDRGFSGIQDAFTQGLVTAMDFLGLPVTEPDHRPQAS